MTAADTTCPPDCRCDEHLIAWANDLRPRDGDRLAPWNLNRPRSPWPTRKPRHTN